MWRGQPESLHKAANRALLTEIRRVHTKHRGRYGAPRIYATLRAARGGGYMASRAPRGTPHASPGQPGNNGGSGMRHRQPSRFADRRQPARPEIQRPNQVWLADIPTCQPRKDGSIWPSCRSLRPQNRRDHMQAEVIIAALTVAIQRQKPPPRFIHHSDHRLEDAVAGRRHEFQSARKESNRLSPGQRS
jgi:putative transposase